MLFFSFFILCNFIFLPNECTGLCRHRPWYSLGNNKKLHKMKNEKNNVGFCIRKIWQIWKRFSRALSWAQTSYFWRVVHHLKAVNLVEGNVFFNFRDQSFTSLMADLSQDINRVSSFSRCINGTFPWRNCSVKTLVY